jgi:hypothetical protein
MTTNRVIDQELLVSAVKNCSFITSKLSEYFILSGDPIYSRAECILAMRDFLRDAEIRKREGCGFDDVYFNTGLKKIKARFLLPLICTAGLHIIEILSKSADPNLTEKTLALGKSLARIPEQFAPPTSRFVLFFRERMYDPAVATDKILLSLAGHRLEAAQAHFRLALVFSGNQERLVECLYTRLCNRPISPVEARDWVRKIAGNDMDDASLTDILNRLTTTARAHQQLEFYQSEFDLLGLDLRISARNALEVSQGSAAKVPYNSRSYADHVLHYVFLLSRIEHFGAEEIMPLLQFVAREAQGETDDHRHALRDEVSKIADGLEGLGGRYPQKVSAIRDWLETEPFG